MSTTLPRFTLTETERIAAAIEIGLRAWPELDGSHAEVARRLIERGAEIARREYQERLDARERAIRETAGKFTGVWPRDAREQLLAEWPE
jgi:hypothetical protein